MHDVICVTSGKGGVGKSTVTANLAMAIAAQGKSCVAIDMDMGLRSLDVLLGLENMVVFDLADVAEGMCRVKQALVRHPARENLFLLGAAGTRGADALTSAQVERVVSGLRERFDFVLIDCPAGLGRGFRNALYAADRAILVGTLDAIMLRDAERLVGLVMQQGLAKPDLLVNRVTARQLGADQITTLAAFEDRLGARLLGLVPEDAHMTSRADAGRPAVMDDCPAGRAFWRVARRVLGENVPIEPMREQAWYARVWRALINR